MNTFTTHSPQLQLGKNARYWDVEIVDLFATQVVWEENRVVRREVNIYGECIGVLEEIKSSGECGILTDIYMYSYVVTAMAVIESGEDTIGCILGR